jgi:hypothetical protein
MKIRRLAFFALASLIPLGLMSQDPSAKELSRPWSVDATLLGPAGLYSVGVNRSIPGLSGKWVTSYLGASAAVFPSKRATKTEFALLPEMNFRWFGQIRHHLETGVIARLEYEHNWDYRGPESHWFFTPTVRLGYCYERPGGRSYIRAGVSPYFEEDVEESYILPLPYLGFGIKF